MENGLFIAFEGIDGSGLTTQAERAKENLEKRAYWDSVGESKEERTTFLTKEPTDGPAGGPLRLALKGRLDVDPETLALFFATDRRDHSTQEIRPMIDDGKIVIADRYYLSSLAYQWADGVDFDWLKTINSKCETPDLTILLDVSAKVAKDRMERDRWHVELYEEEEKLTTIREKYKEAADDLREDGEDIRIVNAEASKDVVERRVMSEIFDKIEEKS